MILNEGVPAEHDSVVVQVLKLQGAVPFVHTNVPQSMFRLGLGVLGGDRVTAASMTWLTHSYFIQLRLQ